MMDPYWQKVADKAEQEQLRKAAVASSHIYRWRSKKAKKPKKPKKSYLDRFKKRSKR